MTVVSRVAKKSRTCNHNCELFTKQLTLNSMIISYQFIVYYIVNKCIKGGNRAMGFRIYGHPNVLITLLLL